MALNKTESNRINAKKSTGPKTPAGKSSIKLNALKLGIYTKDVVLPTEDPAPYRELLAAFRQEYQPETPTEIYLIDNVVTAIWRRRRVQATEIGLQDLLRCEQAERIEANFDNISVNAEMANAIRSDYTHARVLSDLWRHDARLERAIARSIKELQRLKSLRPNEPDAPGSQAGPQTEPTPTTPEPEQNQKQQEQSQTPTTSLESIRSNDQPIQPAVLRATTAAANQTQTECTHKHFLSKSPIAFDEGLS